MQKVKETGTTARLLK